MFIGRESELDELNALYTEDAFQLVVMYGRRRVGKTTLLNEFCKDKEAIFFPAEQSNDKLNLEKFSNLIFQHYHEDTLEPFASWEKALLYIHQRQNDQRLILIFDEFPYLAKHNKGILSMLQHAIDHILRDGRLFLVLCGSIHELYGKESIRFEKPDIWSSDGAVPFEIVQLPNKSAFCEWLFPRGQAETVWRIRRYGNVSCPDFKS